MKFVIFLLICGQIKMNQFRHGLQTGCNQNNLFKIQFIQFKLVIYNFELVHLILIIHQNNLIIKF